MVGSINYAATQTRPDIQYVTGVLSRFLVNPSPVHRAAAKRVLRYLKGTKHLAIVLRGGKLGDEDMKLVGYSDADYARCRDTYKSTYRIVFLFAGRVITSQSKKQTLVA